MDCFGIERHANLRKGFNLGSRFLSDIQLERQPAIGGLFHSKVGIMQSMLGNGAHWVTVWAAMPQLTEDDNMPPSAFNQPDLTFHNSTIRQTLRVTTGGQHLRLRISNAFGQTDLHLTAITIALPEAQSSSGTLAGSKTVHTDSIQTITFGGHPSVDLPRGSLAVSDPASFAVQPGQVITVSIFLRHGQAGGHITSHPGSRTQSWLCHGDCTAARDLDDGSLDSVYHWYFISGVEVWQEQQSCSMVLLGDSLTDGRCSTDNGNDRWPDLLFDRMARHPLARKVAIINQAAGGSRVLKDEKGPNLMSRLDRDVFAQPGVRYVMVFHGVNDIGTAETDDESQRVVGDSLILAYKQIIRRVHAFGFPVFASTITPFSAPELSDYPYSHPTRELTRQRVNTWIRTSGAFDAVIDFDDVLRDPKYPSRLNPAFDSGDFLHPVVAAFRAMADMFPLNIFEEFASGVQVFE